MAILHQAQLTPSKLELLSGWLPAQPWFVGEADAEFVNVAAFRFDDPEGEVGVETILVRAGDGPTLQVPLTYRGAPLAGAETSLIGTMEHSALGKRWVYDGIGDPVYLQTTATAALNGGHHAELFVEAEGGRVQRTPNALVSGSGTSTDEADTPSVTDVVTSQEGTLTIVEAGELHVRIQRVVGGDMLRRKESNASALLATWAGSDVPQELVVVAMG